MTLNTYKKQIFFAISIVIVNFAFAQNANDDNKLLKDVVPSIFSRIYEKKSYIKEKPCEFFNKQEFFTVENFTLYTKVSAVNNQEQVKRMKKLLKNIDFDYLLKYNIDNSNWDLKGIKYKNLVEQKQSKKFYEIAKPIYSKDGKYAFVYYQYNCGSLDCGAYFGVKIFKLCKNKWKFYINMAA